jgi:hypothetical protein
VRENEYYVREGIEGWKKPAIREAFFSSRREGHVLRHCGAVPDFAAGKANFDIFSASRTTSLTYLWWEPLDPL